MECFRRVPKVHRSGGAGLQLGNDAAVHGILGRATGQPRIAGQPVHRGAGVVAGPIHGGDRTNDRVLVGDPAQPRHQFADIEPRHP